MSVALVAVDDRAPRGPRSESWRLDFIGTNGGRCHYCNRVGTLEMGPGGRPWHIDHKDPIALGGTDEDSNLALACKRCNLAKSAKPYKLFKALAESAYWTPDEGGPSEAELDHLAKTHADTAGMRIFASPDNAPGGAVLHMAFGTYSDPHTEPDLIPDPFLAGIGGYAGHEERDVAKFTAAAHRIVPTLIAEIHLLRRTLAERDGT